MKLSEAILLGSTILSPRAGAQHFSETQQGCALGMAAVARGLTFHPWTRPFDERDRRTLGVEGVWGSWVLQEVARPCDCWRFWLRRRMRIKEVITHLFDYHIMVKKNWTLEQLVAWVETVEPKEIHSTKISHPVPLRQPVQSHEAATLRDQAEQWRAVVDNFTAHHPPNRRGR